MPVSPRQVRSEQEAKGLAEYLAITKKIDEYLADSDITQPVYYSCRGLDQRVISRIIHSYMAVGWLVHFVADQRDGDYLEFRARA